MSVHWGRERFRSTICAFNLCIFCCILECNTVYYPRFPFFNCAIMETAKSWNQKLNIWFLYCSHWFSPNIVCSGRGFCFAAEYNGQSLIGTAEKFLFSFCFISGRLSCWGHFFDWCCSPAGKSLRMDGFCLWFWAESRLSLFAGNWIWLHIALLRWSSCR